MKKTKRHFSFFTKLMLFFNGIVVLAMLLAYLAPVTDPRKFWPIAFFGLAYPPLLLLNVLFCVYWVIVRQSKLALISVITILVGYNVLLDNVGFSFSKNKTPQTSTPGKIRILTYNVHNFQKDGVTKDDTVRRGMLRTMAAIKPDVIGIQEFFTRNKGRYAMNDSIRDILNMLYRHSEPNMKTDQEEIGVSIFSRFPIVSKGSVAIAPAGSGNQCIYADIKTDGKIVRFYCLHLQSIQFEQQDYQYIDTITKKGKADIASTRRLGAKLKRAFLKRAEQVFKIKQHAAQSPYPYIISGDFNDTPASFAVSQIQKGLKNTFREKGLGLGRTYNGDFPNYQIDYIMATPQFNVLSYNIVQQKLSDHYPVYADLVLQ